MYKLNDTQNAKRNAIEFNFMKASSSEKFFCPQRHEAQQLIESGFKNFPIWKTVRKWSIIERDSPTSSPFCEQIIKSHHLDQLRIWFNKL